MRFNRSAVVAVALLALAGCSLVLGPTGGQAEAARYPEGCGAFDLPATRCAAIVDAIARRQDVDPAAASAIWLLGDPGCGGDPHVLCTRTTSFVVRVRLDFPGGRSVEDSQFCGVGGQYSLLCTNNPEVRFSSPTFDGYLDIPCSGEPPDGCASPVPTVEPAAALRAEALRVPAIDVVLDHDGSYDLSIGKAVLPNGLLTESSFSLVDPHQTGFVLDGGVIALVVAGPDGKPIWNAYEQGWRDGVEVVDVSLRFTIEHHDPGAVIQVRNVLVR